VVDAVNPSTPNPNTQVEKQPFALPRVVVIPSCSFKNSRTATSKSTVGTGARTNNGVDREIVARENIVLDVFTLSRFP
jgi:hypothetical protein